MSQFNEPKKSDFTQIYKENYQRIYKFVLFKVQDEDIAQDITQQTFLNALKSLGKYQDHGLSFSSWLYTIARNLIVDYYRKNNKEVNIEDFLENLSEEPAFLNQALDREQLDRAIEKLTDIEQQVIILRFLEGLSLDEIAQVLGKTKGALSTIQYRSLEKLKKILIN